MFPKYFQQELTQLRELGAEFSKTHPALAPMLSGVHADPDVERLLEGTAFLTALLRQKLDDEFPEVIHDLTQIVAPQYLNPTPSASIVAFTPKATVRNSLNLPAGIQCASVPIEGTACLFHTCYDVELHPLALTGASFVQIPGRPPAVKISFELNGLNLSQWKPSALRFYLADDFSQASDLYRLLLRHVRSIRLVPQKKGESFELRPSYLRPVGFSPEESLTPAAGNTFHGFGVLQEYFLMPQKFLFLDLLGWENWSSRGEGKGFEVIFELDEIPPASFRINKNSFLLHATPVINLFEHEAEPIYLDHQRTEYPVRPAGLPKEAQIFSVDEVKGFIQGTSEEKSYVPFDLFHRNEIEHPVYHLAHTPSITAEGVDLGLSVAYRIKDGMPPAPETLQVRLKCTNGSLTGRLKTGDITTHAKGCPEYVTFKNILPPTPGMPSRVGKNMLWQLLSHLAMGFQSMEKVETVKSLLGNYIFSESSDPETLAHRKRIEGILEIHSGVFDHLISGTLARGRELSFKIRGDHFASRGDLYLFGNVLDSFFTNYASMNSFVRLKIHDVTAGSHITWPARTGNRRLL